MSEEQTSGVTCPLPGPVEAYDIELILLDPQPPLADYREAMALADWQARQHLGECMLLSWYDRDRDFESPQHSSECHMDSATPGYVDYGIHHGAKLKVDIHGGRFVFFYLPLGEL
ncbi:MAG: AF1514 family protein [Chromatiales bacterium]|jgi:hypothetical protein